MNVRLGYEVGTGTEVVVPLKHLAICGQTQEAGKTTTLEALITRSGLRALTFVTKRGEGSFTHGVRHQPYFREQADWQFVASILEASRGERLKFERAWIIRASRGATTLEEVQHNVRRAMHKAKGLSADVYLTLDAYLDQVVPTIGRLNWADMIVLRPGVNVMDLSDIPTEMQHLVIKSSLDWVLNTSTETVVVIPEAWKFIPQGRGTPVKLACEALIRQGAALKNYVWLDSQDLGGIEKTILRSVAVWLLGVQREANEIKRTLDNIPGGVAKPSRSEIATLDLGQFYACWRTHAIKTYAQPVWLSDDTAQAVALGRVAVDKAFREEAKLTDEEVGQLLKENRRLVEENSQFRNEIHALRHRIMQLEVLDHAVVAPGEAAAPPEPVPNSAPLPPESGTANYDGAAKTLADYDAEFLYQTFKTRLLNEALSEPRLMQVLTSRPEVIVEVKPVAVTVDGGSVKGRVARLMVQGWFKEPRAVGAVRKELARTGADPGGGGALGILLGNLVKDRFLTREGTEFMLAPGVKVQEREVRVS